MIPRGVSMSKVVIAGALVHAVCVTLLWVAAMHWDTRVVSGPVWVVLAWTWLLWPILLLSTSARSSRHAIAAVVVGAVALAPTAGEIYAFTVWTVGGFAP